MSEEFGLTNSGTDGVIQIPVESKEYTLVPASVEKGLEEAKNGELLDSPEDFSKYVEEFYCATCRERYSDLTVMKINAGENRNAIFCPSCSKSLGFLDSAAKEKLVELHKNPTSK